MAHLWFSQSDDSSVDDHACFCDTCVDPFTDVRPSLAPYWHRGLKIKEGDKITLVTIKKCNAIVTQRLEEIHQPTKLEALCGRVIRRRLHGHYKQLPLPVHIQNRVRFGEYEEEVGGNFVKDCEFDALAKKLPGILWHHLGCTVIRRRKHPLNRF